VEGGLSDKNVEASKDANLLETIDFLNDCLKCKLEVINKFKILMI